MLEFLPAVNASLNALSGVLLLIAFSFIKRKKIETHRKFMISAFIVSIVFLMSYLVHKAVLFQLTGKFNTTFSGDGIWRVFYFVLLITHVALAATVPVLAVITIRRGLAMSVISHRKIAKIAFPVWMYVSVTGVVVYFMLYHWFPSHHTGILP